MEIQELTKQYASRPQVQALAKVVKNDRERIIQLEGLQGSAAPLVFGSLSEVSPATILFILQDAEEAGYFYHDLMQLMGGDRVLFFPSSYRRSVKYAQRDAANEILRTETLTRLKVIDERYDYQKSSESPRVPANHIFHLSSTS